MIINIRALLDKVKDLKKNSNKLDFKMEYSNGSYVPSFKQDESNKISIPPQDGDNFLVGLAILSEDRCVLTNNGLMINRANCKATDVLLFSSWEDAINFCAEAGNFISLSSIGSLTIYAAYQHKSKENHLLFRYIAGPYKLK